MSRHQQHGYMCYLCYIIVAGRCVDPCSAQHQDYTTSAVDSIRSWMSSHLSVLTSQQKDGLTAQRGTLTKVQPLPCSSLEHHYVHDVSFGKETHRANNTRHNHFWSLNCPSFTPPYPPTTIFSNIPKDALQKGIRPICAIKAWAGISVCSWLHQNTHKQSDGGKEKSWRGEGCSQTTSRVAGISSSPGGVWLTVSGKSHLVLL